MAFGISPLMSLFGVNTQQDQTLNYSPAQINLTSADTTANIANAANNLASSAGTTTGPSQSDINTSIIASGIMGGINSYVTAASQNRQASAKASYYKYQAATAAANVASAKRGLYDTARSYEYRAMLQGLQQAQTISRTRTSAASRGVRLGVGSTGEIETSQRLSARMNQIVLNQEKTQALNNARTQIANYQAQQIIAEGNVKAQNALKTNAALMGGLGLIQSLAMSDMSWQQKGYNTPMSGSFF